jgi:hypothetical protein
VVHGVVEFATSHVAWLAVKARVTGYTPILREVIAPPQCTVIVRTADWITAPVGIFDVSKSSSERRTYVASLEMRVTSSWPSKLTAAYVPPRIAVSWTTEAPVSVTVVCALPACANPSRSTTAASRRVHGMRTIITLP